MSSGTSKAKAHISQHTDNYLEGLFLVGCAVRSVFPFLRTGKKEAVIPTRCAGFSSMVATPTIRSQFRPVCLRG
jgi:hypothetical protein